MFLSRLTKIESGRLLRSDKSKTSRYELSEYWYMELILDISANTKKSTAPSLAAGRYPSRSLSISIAVLAPSFNFSATFSVMKEGRKNTKIKIMKIVGWKVKRKK